jgi:hypothetical protein
MPSIIITYDVPNVTVRCVRVLSDDELLDVELRTVDREHAGHDITLTNNQACGFTYSLVVYLEEPPTPTQFTGINELPKLAEAVANPASPTGKVADKAFSPGSPVPKPVLVTAYKLGGVRTPLLGGAVRVRLSDIVVPTKRVKRPLRTCYTCKYRTDTITPCCLTCGTHKQQYVFNNLRALPILGFPFGLVYSVMTGVRARRTGNPEHQRVAVSAAICAALDTVLAVPMAWAVVAGVTATPGFDPSQLPKSAVKVAEVAGVAGGILVRDQTTLVLLLLVIDTTVIMPLQSYGCSTVDG